MGAVLWFLMLFVLFPEGISAKIPPMTSVAASHASRFASRFSQTECTVQASWEALLEAPEEGQFVC